MATRVESCVGGAIAQRRATFREVRPPHPWRLTGGSASILAVEHGLQVDVRRSRQSAERTHGSFVGRRRMRLALAALVLAPLGVGQSPAPQPDRAILEARFADKLAQPFLLLQPWHRDLEQAKRAAAREGKPILVHCTRSFTPCGTSISCERQVLSDPDFGKVAERAVLYCHVTTHLDKDADQLLYELRGSGWPHHAVLDATGRVLGTHESHRDKSVAELLALLDRAQAYLRLEADVAREVAMQRRRQLDAGLAAGALDLASARALLAQCGALTRSDAERFAGALTDLEVADVLRRHDRFDERAQIAAGGEIHGLWRMGKRPAERNASRDFWGGLLLWLEKQDKPDLTLYREALGELDKRFGDARGYRSFLDARRKALEELQRKAETPGKIGA